MRQALGLPRTAANLSDTIQQLATIEDDFAERLGIDFRGLYPLNSHNWGIEDVDAGAYWAYHDEWGITHHRPKDGGLYYSIVEVPLPSFDVTEQEIAAFPWPDMGARWRVEGLRAQAEQFRAAGYAVVLKDAFAGIFEFAQRVIGMENLLMLMGIDEQRAGVLFDKLLEMKLSYWETALDEVGDLVDVVTYADDYGTQYSQLISPAMFRKQLKPRVRQIFELQAALAPHAKRFFHSDGNVRPLIPDFIEIGVDILNPVQTTAAGMDPVELKREYGQDLVSSGAPASIRRASCPTVRRKRSRKMCGAISKPWAPGGGYVFNTVHNIQADVPPAEHPGHVGSAAGVRCL